MGEKKYASLSTKDAVAGGGAGFGPGPATIKKARWAMFDYKKKGATKSVLKPALVVTYERDGETGKEPYSCGSGWAVTKDGLRIESLHDQPGLADNCNALYFIEALEEAGMPTDFLETPDQLDGLEVVLVLKPIERDFGKDDGGVKKKSLLVVGTVENPPWESGGKKGKGGAKKKDDDDDSEDEKPKRRSSKDEEDEEDEDEKTKSKNGKASKGKDDDEPNIDEEATEALIDALADGPLAIDDIEDAVRKALKGNAQRQVIAARCAEDDFLGTEKGWSVNKKKQTVELD